MAIQNDANSPRTCFLITMWIDATGEAFVRSCEVIGNSFRNRTSFGDNATLDAAFSVGMVQALKQCLLKLSRSTEVLVLPNYSIELPDLALLAPQIVATKISDGSVNIIMRFRSLLGNVCSAFKEDVGLSFASETHCSHLSIEVLNEIVAPLLDICASAEAEMEDVVGELGNFGRQVAQRSHEIRFHAELLKRFVGQNMRKMVTPVINTNSKDLDPASMETDCSHQP